MTVRISPPPETNVHVAPPISLAHALRALTTHELVRLSADDRAVFMFKHALVQETVHATLLKNENRRLHHLVAAALEQVNADRLDDYAAELAQHYAQAEDNPKTLEYSTRAGDKAARVFANEEALLHYARAIKIAKQGIATPEEIIYLFRQRGRILEVIGRFHDALQNYLELHEIAVARNDRQLELGYLTLRAPLHSSPMPTFDAPLAKQLLLDALGTARELGDEEAEARILWNLSLLSTHIMRPADGLMYGELSLALAERLDLREQKAYTLHELFVPYRATGQIARARATQQEARALFHEMDNLPMLADNLGMSAQFAVNEGDLDGSLAFATEGTALSRMVGNRFGIDFNQGFVATVELERGDYAAVLDTLQDQLAAIRQGATIVNGLWVAGVVGLHFGQIGALDVTREMQDRVRLMKRLPVPPVFAGGLVGLLARICLLLNDDAGAAAELANGSAEMDLAGALSPGSIQLPIARAELAIARSDFSAALAALEPQAEWALVNEYQLILTENLALQGCAYAGLGEWAKASHVLSNAQGLASKMNGRRLLWQILALLCEVETARGNRAAAEEFRAEARDLVNYIVDHMPAEMHANFLNLPRVRAVSNVSA